MNMSGTGAGGPFGRSGEPEPRHGLGDPPVPMLTSET
jgi:hypothetical protein